MEKTIYDLNLHEVLRIDGFGYATRVPGGWLYENYENDHPAPVAVFVPFNNEFQPAR